MKAELENRPLLLGAISLIAGVTTLTHPSHVLFLLALVAFFKLLRIRLFVAGFFLLGLLIAPPEPFLLTKSKPFDGPLKVLDQPHLTKSGESFLGVVGHAVYDVSTPGSTRIDIGDQVWATGLLHPLHGEFEEQLAQQGVSAMLAARSASCSSNSP